MRISGVLAFTLLIGVGAAVAGQAPQPSTPGQTTQPGQPAPGQPSRTPARPLRPGELPPKGTAAIRGQVLAAGSGTPIRRAQVRAMSNDGRGGGVTSTDSEGRYEIKDLAGGRFDQRDQERLQHQPVRPASGEPGTPIELADGVTADKLNFTLARGGVIAGRILDDTSDPMAGVQVAAMRYGFMAGSRRLIGAGGEGSNDRTDDQGGFRLYGLPPGDYYVSATYRSMMMVGPEINNTQTDGLRADVLSGHTQPRVSAARFSKSRTGGVGNSVFIDGLAPGAHRRAGGQLPGRAGDARDGDADTS